MDQLTACRATASMASEAQLCRLLAAQLSLESEARALLRQAAQIEAAIAARAGCVEVDATCSGTP
jgi:hypothetical protein